MRWNFKLEFDLCCILKNEFKCLRFIDLCFSFSFNIYSLINYFWTKFLFVLVEWLERCFMKIASNFHCTIFIWCYKKIDHVATILIKLCADFMMKGNHLYDPCSCWHFKFISFWTMNSIMQKNKLFCLFSFLLLVVIVLLIIATPALALMHMIFSCFFVEPLFLSLSNSNSLFIVDFLASKNTQQNVALLAILCPRSLLLHLSIN